MNALRSSLCGAAFALLLGACDATVDVSARTALSPGETRLAADLVGQALADGSEGMVSDLYDMDAGVDAKEQILLYHDGPLARGLGMGNVRPWRTGRALGSLVRYDSTTGTYRVSYQRTHEAPGFYRTVEADLAYVFTDAAGAPIRDPRPGRNRIVRTTFDGTRVGETRFGRTGTTAESRATFRRVASWTLSGFNGTAATFRGDQTSTGSTRLAADSTLRTFTIRVRAENVTLTRARLATGIEASLGGTVQYDVTLKRPGEAEKHAAGTLDLQPNGQVFLRFMGLGGRYRVDLVTGTTEPQ